MTTAAILERPQQWSAGDRRTLVRTITESEINDFARVSGDCNPLHLDAEFARTAGFRGVVAHGILLSAYISQVIGMILPGPGGLWVDHRVCWRSPVIAGDTVTFEVTVLRVSRGAAVLVLRIAAHNQHGDPVLEGEATVKQSFAPEVRSTVPSAGHGLALSDSDSALLDSVRAIFASLFDLDPAAVRPETSPEEIEAWDSIQHLNLTLALEQEFGIQFTPNEIELLISPGAIAQLVNAKQRLVEISQ